MNIDLMLSLPRDASTIGLVRHVARCALVELGATDETVDVKPGGALDRLMHAEDGSG